MVIPIGEGWLLDRTGATRVVSPLSERFSGSGNVRYKVRIEQAILDVGDN